MRERRGDFRPRKSKPYERTMFDGAYTGGGEGGSDDDLPWSNECFAVGDRVKWTAKAIRYSIPTKSRRDLRGTVTAVGVGASGVTYSVDVLWDTYKHSHRYASSFITKAR